MAEDLITELIDSVAEDFKNYLENASNYRIIFSGRFGKGKSTFLNYFFENQEHYLKRKRYNTFYLNPVGYSIAGNEDVIKYINHRCDCNCEVDEGDEYSLKLIASRDIKRGEELTIDYGYDEIYEYCQCQYCI